MKHFIKLGLLVCTVVLLGASCIPGTSVRRSNTPVNNGQPSSTNANVDSQQPSNQNPNILPVSTPTKPIENPNTSTTQMLPCNSNAQCVSGKLCVDSQCVPAETVLPTDPATGQLLCSNNAQCVSGKLCVNQRCVPAETVLPSDPTTGELLCANNAQCVSGKLCVNQRCVAAETVLPTNPATGQLLCSNDAQCVQGKVCVNGSCVATTTPKSSTVTTSCTLDSQCKLGEACFQGRCTAVPATCKYHTECLSDDYVCSNGTCVWPQTGDVTCQNAYGDRWHCLSSKKCGTQEFECI
ncbi:MAG TPA: hypothetical protein VJH75_00120 [Patescibacteria group bacterium]|nr:hypothetical protein [Patescibacteria group bacterium]